MTTTSEDPAVATGIRFVFRDQEPDGSDAEYSVHVATDGELTPEGPPGSRQDEGPVTEGLGRFVLDPKDVAGVYPAPDSSGDFTRVLPHVRLSRADLPWTRPTQHGGSIPAVALVLFAEDEITDAPHATASTRVYTVEQLLGSNEPNVLTPDIELSTVPKELRNARCATIDVPADLAAAVMPSRDDTRYLVHTLRVAGDRTRAVNQGDHAVVLSNRFPRGPHPRRYVAHLVSLEGHAYHLGDDGRPTTTAVRLVSLWTWSFINQTDQPNRFAMLNPARDTPAKDHRLRPPTEAIPPQSEANTAHPRIGHGYLPITVTSPTGEATLCWYRSVFTPIVPPPTQRPPTPAQHAGRDTERHDDVDLTYAVAYELGRLCAQSAAPFTRRASRTRTGLPVLNTLMQQCLRSGPTTQPETSSDDNVRQVSLAALLTAIPFEYLVPDSNMLPQERVRQFYLDPQWLNTFLAGTATTDAGGAKLDPPTDALIFPPPTSTTTAQPPSGILIRSGLVREWPDLVITPYPERDRAGGTAAVLVRTIISSPDTLLLVFDRAGTVVISEPADEPRFGVDDTDRIILRRLTNSSCGQLGRSFPAQGKSGIARYLRPVPSGGREVLAVHSLVESLTTALREANALDRPAVTPAGLAIQLMANPQQLTIAPIDR